MGVFVTPPMTVAAGNGYDEWITRLTLALKDLVASGRTPDFGGLDTFFELSERMRHCIKSGADAAARSGQGTFIPRIPMSPADRRTLGATGESLKNYLEILTMRGVVDATRSPECIEALAVLAQGDLQDEES